MFSKPFTANPDLKIGGLSNIKAKSIGSRSAYLPLKKLKFKGCRPKPDLYFPHEKLDFGQKKMSTDKILFGCLSAENVMREILAYFFFKSYKIQINQEPYCVFEYKYKNKVIGYCIVFKTPTDKRLESSEDYLNLSIAEMIKIKFIENKFNLEILPNESIFLDIPPKAYTKEKSDLLIKMNFNGGFRGILNSNLGNDIFYKNKFYICDFDTFKIKEIQKNPDRTFIKNFLRWCLIELIKSSPFVYDYLDIEKVDKKSASEIMWKSYSEKSSLWREYYAKFIKNAKALGWDIGWIKESLDELIKEDIFYEMILDNLLNSKVLMNTYKPELSFYRVH
jgi:hypothetical protein